MTLETLFLDDQLLVVSKPPGLLAQADRTGDPDVLTLGKQMLREKQGRDPFLGLVHRLDRPASGIMVLARTSEAARNLAAQFRERLVEKRYLAIVEGRPERWGTATDYLLKERGHVQVVPASHPKGQRAELSWQVLDQSADLSLVEVDLKTGRPHQVRVQFAHRGHPLLGDFRYGAERELDGQNLALHAYQLSLEHPEEHKMMRWTAPPPSSWQGLFEQTITTFVAARQR